MDRIFISTFSVYQEGKRTSINGMIEPMLSYFLPKSKEVDLLDGLHPGSSSVLTFIEEYKKGKICNVHKSITSKVLYPFLLLQNKSKTQVVFKLRDFLSAIEWGIRSRKKYDYYIGMESIYTLSGIFLKKIGIVKKVIYYVSDYSPSRYSQNWFNKVYLNLDRFCAEHSDYIWDVSSAMHPGRLKAGLDPKKSAPVIIVPNALFPSQISYLEKDKVVKDSIVYAGTLGLENGPDLAIEAIAMLAKTYPNISLHIFGGEEQKQEYLKELVTKLKIEKNVLFHGFIPNADQLSKNIKNYMIGVAPYRKKEDSVRRFGDATKLRLYMGCGLPIITTDVPPLGREIAKKGAAVIVEDTKEDFAKAIKTILKDPKKYSEIRKHVVAYAKTNTWENTYSSAFLQMKK